MDIGIFLPAMADSWQLVKRAESLGFGRAWFYDTQMLTSELFVSMTAAAICGGSSPWANASPQPDSPSSVRISTRVALR